MTDFYMECNTGMKRVKNPNKHLWWSFLGKIVNNKKPWKSSVEYYLTKTPEKVIAVVVIFLLLILIINFGNSLQNSLEI